MEITAREIKHIELITISGRVDSEEAAHLVKALESAQQRGKYKIVLDMRRVEYMSSAGFRALGDAQRKSQKSQRGEVVLAAVPEVIRDGLDLVGFTDHFHIENSVEAALAFAEKLPSRESASGN